MKKHAPDCKCCLGTGHTVTRNTHIQIGRRLYKSRLKANIPLKNIAQYMQLRPSTLSDMEHGRRIWTVGTIADYEAAVNHCREVYDGDGRTACHTK